MPEEHPQFDPKDRVSNPLEVTVMNVFPAITCAEAMSCTSGAEPVSLENALKLGGHLDDNGIAHVEGCPALGSRVEKGAVYAQIREITGNEFRIEPEQLD